MRQVNLNEIRQDPQITLLLTPVEDLPCPVCGAPRVNSLYCLGCGELFDPRLRELAEAVNVE